MTKIIAFPHPEPKAVANPDPEQAKQSLIESYSFAHMLLAREFITEVTDRMETLTRDLNLILAEAGLVPGEGENVQI